MIKTSIYGNKGRLRKEVDLERILLNRRDMCIKKNQDHQ